MDSISNEEKRNIKALINEKNSSADRVDFLYKSKTDSEEYLLGKAVDAAFERENIPAKKESDVGAIFDEDPVAHNERMNKQIKEREDPLMAIRQKEHNARRELLNNPVKMKQLERAIKERQKAAERRRRSSSGDELLARYMAIKGEKQESTSSKKKKKRKLPDDDKSLLKRYLELIGKAKRKVFYSDTSDDEETNPRSQGHENSINNSGKGARRPERHGGDSNDAAELNRSGQNDKRRGSRRPNDDRRDSRMPNDDRRDNRRPNDDRRDSRRPNDDRRDNRKSDDGNDSRPNYNRHYSRESTNDRLRNAHTSHDKKQDRHTIKNSNSSKVKDSLVERGRDRYEHRHGSPVSSKDKKHRRSSSSENDEKNKTDHISRKKKRRESSSSSSQSSSSSRSRSSRSKSRGSTSSRSRSNRSSSSRTSHESSDSEKKGTKTKTPSFGLVHPKGRSVLDAKAKLDAARYSKYEDRQPASQQKEEDNSKASSTTRATSKRLTREEKEQRLREMMDNAEWREEQRSKNVRRYIEEEEKEDEEYNRHAGKDDDFIAPLMTKHADESSVEDQLRRHRNKLQRKSSATAKDFARK